MDKNKYRQTRTGPSALIDSDGFIGECVLVRRELGRHATGETITVNHENNKD